MISSGWLLSVCNLNANILEQPVSIFIGGYVCSVLLSEQSVCSIFTGD
jgi:hypothetical protein